MMNEIPLIAASSYAANTMSVADAMQQSQAISGDALRNDAFMHKLQLAQQNMVPTVSPKPASPQKENTPMANQRRLVQVLIVDPHEHVPLEDCLLYSGEQKLTDLTDQELFFEIDIKSILDKHNEKRTKLVNKSVKERVEYLDAVRIRDLKMTVVNIAQF